MALAFKSTRGLAIGPALVFVLCACAPVPPPPPPGGSLAEARAALSRGDAVALRACLGHGAGLAARAGGLAERLDPRAWLAVMGASWREHDLAACQRAMQAGDDTALASALGFGPQALAADILQAGRTVYPDRSGGMDYFSTSEAPLSLLEGELIPALAAGVAGYELAAWGRAGDRLCRVRAGRNARGISNLQASADPALDGPARPRNSARAATPIGAVGDCRQGLPLLSQSHWIGLEVRVVADDGTLEEVRLGRDEQGWYMVERTVTGLQARLESERDRRLELIRRTALGVMQASGRWPRDESQITLRAQDYADPASPQGRRGWADHDTVPPRGLRLVAPGAAQDIAVEATHPGPSGRRAITREGNLVWLPAG